MHEALDTWQAREGGPRGVRRGGHGVPRRVRPAGRGRPVVGGGRLADVRAGRPGRGERAGRRRGARRSTATSPRSSSRSWRTPTAASPSGTCRWSRWPTRSARPRTPSRSRSCSRVDGRVADVDADPRGGRRGRCPDRLRRHAGRRLAARWTRRCSTSTVCASYKWLSAPRGTAFLTVRPGPARPAPPDERRLVRGRGDLVVGLRARDGARHGRAAARRLPRLALLGGRGPGAGAVRGRSARRRPPVHRRPRRRLPCGPRPGRPAAARSSALPDDAAGSRRALLAAQGTRAAGRGGGVRLAFHVWNDAADVERAVAALSNS